MQIPHYTSRVGKRADIATLILAKYMTQAQGVGLLESDLQTIKTEGDNAKKADHDQHEEATLNAIARSAQSKTAGDLLGAEEGEIRDRMPGVISDLMKVDAKLAVFFKRISYTRYRVREHAPEEKNAGEQPAVPALTPAEEAEVKTTERVEKQDLTTRLEGLEALCTSILKPGREAVVTAFANRKLGADRIKTIGEQAGMLAKAAKNKPKAAEATEREAAAVRAQREAWNNSRRMIRKLAAKVPELAELYADC